jgi:carbon storage regulator
MLVLTRKLNESIVINGDIVVTLLEVGRNGQVRLGIDAPRHYQIYRRELWLEIEQENRQALASALDPTSAPAALAATARENKENLQPDVAPHSPERPAPGSA